MFKLIVAASLLFVAGTAVASDQIDVMGPVHQFIDGMNKGDSTSALAACAAPAFIIDEFPPFQWAGPTACADWAADVESYNKKYGITDAVATIRKPRHIDITGDRAYLVIPATYAYKHNIKRITESGSSMTVALQKTADGWRITGWAWTRGSVR